jgi:hypothetical protein
MKCEHFVLNHETGSALARLRARLHARRCAKCAATQRRLADLGDVLASPAELTPYHRRVWERAASDSARELAPARPWLTPPRLALAGGLAVAAAVVVAIMLSAGGKQTPDGGTIVKSPNSPSSVIAADRIQPEDVAHLQIGLDQVERELQRLADDAELLEARSAISELAALYPPLGNGDSS